MRTLKNHPAKSALLLIALLTITLATAGCTSMTEASEPDAPVAAAEAKALKPQSIEVFGKVIADEKLLISLSEAVKIDKVIAKEGTLLQKGSPIMRLKTNDLKVKLEVAEQTEASITTMLSDSQMLLNRAKTELALSLKELEEAQRQYSTQNQLHQSGAATTEDLQRYKLASDKAASDVAVKKIEISRIEAENQKRTAEKAKLLSEVKHDKVLLNSILKDSIDLKQGQIISRFEAGTITKLNASTGEFVPSGQSLCELVNLDSLYVLAEVPEEFIQSVSVGTTATITPTANKGSHFSGTVESIWNTAIEKNGETLIPVRIQLDSYKGLLPNYNVDIQFHQ